MNNQINPHPRVTARIAFITPALAAHYISKNLENQRSVKRRNLERITNMIREQSFVLNGESIIIADTGRLLNGNHRLHSIVNTGIGVWTVLVEGISEDVFPTIDQGASRNSADVLHIAGYKNAVNLATSATRLAEYLRAPALVGSGVALSNSQKLSIIQSHPGLADSVDKFVCNSKLHAVVAASQGAWLHYITLGHPGAERFWNLLETGSMLQPNDPILVLRERLIRRKTEGFCPVKETQAFLIKAYNASIQGKTFRFIKWAESEQFPILITQNNGELVA